VATPTDPDGEFITPLVLQSEYLRESQKVLLGVHAPLSDIVAKPERFDPAAIDRIRDLIKCLDIEVRSNVSVDAKKGLEHG